MARQSGQLQNTTGKQAKAGQPKPGKQDRDKPGKDKGQREAKAPASKTTVQAAAAKPRARKAKIADTADKHRLYERAVQQPDAEVDRFRDLYHRVRGRDALTMREDFCGTAALARAWCERGPEFRAYGVDLDLPTLEFGRAHNITPKVAGRLKLIHGDVCDAKTPKVDLACAMNFSFCVFKERGKLLEYLKHARAGMTAKGVLLLEIYGGTESMQELEEDREYDGFTYIWEQESFDPLTHETVCHIHFKFPDRSRIDRAFTYDWRLWTVPELRDLLLEAGFSSVRTFWERLEEDDEDKDMLVGTGEFIEVTSAENQESFLAYVMGVV